jgi:hypothetical protein
VEIRIPYLIKPLVDGSCPATTGAQVDPNQKIPRAQENADSHDL